MPRSPNTLVDLLQWRADVTGEKLAYLFVEDSDSTRSAITYAQLETRARAIAAELEEVKATGERALLLYPPGLDFIAAFFGCLYAGVTAVPIYPPRLNRPMPRIQAIVRDAEARFALTTGAILDGIEKRFEHEPLLESLHWRDTEQTPEERARDWKPQNLTADRLAFLQYTSGSTSAPKGVMLTHGNLLHNLEMIRQGFHLGDAEKGVFWLPSYHDMGLIGGILEPMYIAGSSMLISSVAFLQRPYRWLQGITDFEATITGAPNFAFDLCVEKITPQQMETLDLGSLKLCFTGAEPVRPKTMARFAEIFEPQGFDRRTLYPCYGLAEATLLVAGGDGPGNFIQHTFDREALKSNRAILTEDPAAGQDFVSCGKALFDEEIRIVDPESLLPCRDGAIGEIWVKGNHVARGYWGRPELSRETFAASTADTGDGPFLRTGDLGFLWEKELFITGRLKDLIIIRGRNHYPQDIEETFADAHEAVEKLSTVAFSYEHDGEERLAVVAEVTRKHRSPEMEEIAPILRRAVAEGHGLQLDALVLVKPLSIPKTSSGKIKRQATKTEFLNGALAVVGEWFARAEAFKSGQLSAGSPPTEFKPGKRRGHELDDILQWLLSEMAGRLNLPAGRINPDEAFVTYGLDSAAAVSLTGDLENFLGRSLSPTLAWDYPTPRLLAAHLAGSEQEPVPAAAPARSQSAGNSEGIAVIGMACRFPGAPDLDAFWELLLNGLDAIREVPQERFDVEALYDPDPAAPGRLITKWGGFLPGVDRFDAAFFGISPREAARMDPQQRILMETAWEALEAAGIPANRLAGTSAGVFIGISSSDYSRYQFNDPDRLDAYAGTGNAHSIAANRLSYFFDLRGPSIAVDTACSSSLVSVHSACQSLQSGETDLAIAGGVNLILSPELTVTFSQARMLAPDGRCKTFDASADGYVRGEGCGVVVLKRLSDALRDGDPVLAVVRGSAVNQDGRSNGLTAPNGPSQEDVIRRALRAAGIAPHQVGYVEAHGTGTPLGDPIEMHALRNVFGKERLPENPLRVGSVKTNIGHLEAAAGIAGFIKAVLTLHYGQIPPHLHLQTLNPYISLDGAPIRVPVRTEPWVQPDTPRVAGVSSFGFGGTNAHVVLSEHPPIGPAVPETIVKRPYSLFTLSARSQEALTDLAARFERADLPELVDAAYTTQVGRMHFEHRRAIVAGSKEELRARLRSGSGSAFTDSPAVAFLFTGQGAQYPGMTRRLYTADSTYRRVLDECAALAAQHLNLPLLDLIFSEDERIHETRYAQPALFAVEVAMARMWEAWGIVPDYLLGHSIGEWAAACFAGVLSLEDAMRVVIHRGRLMQSAPGEGGMLAVAATEDLVRALLEPFADRLDIAAVNGPASVAVSGDLAALSELQTLLDVHGIPHRPLMVSHGFHSPLMEPVQAEFRDLLSSVRFSPPRIPIAINSDGALQMERALDADYWTAHIRRPIRFSAGIETLLDRGVKAFLEIGPRPILLGLTRRILKENELAGELLPTVDDSGHDWETVLTALGRLFELGCNVDWQAFNAGTPLRRVRLPGYPFRRERHWLEPPAAAATFVRDLSPGRRLEAAVPIFETSLPVPSQPVLLELALAAGRAVLENEDCAILEMRFERPVHKSVVVQTVFSDVTPSSARFSIHARDGAGWIPLAIGILSAGASGDLPGMGVAGERMERSGPGFGPDGESRSGEATGVREFLAAQAASALGLPVSRLPIDRSLNQLGLDSLMAVEVRNAIEKQYGVEIPIVHFLEGPTLEALSARLEELLETGAALEGIPVGDPAQAAPLTYGQQALWFLHEMTGDDLSFNIAGVVKIEGPFHVGDLAAALESLIRRYPALTTTFHLQDDGPVQRQNAETAAPLLEIDARNWTEERIAGYLRKEAWRKFQLDSGPPFRVRVLRFIDGAAERHLVLFSVDHMVADFWSVSLILSHLLQAYQNNGLALERQQGPVRFTDAARWLNARVESAEGQAHLAYWKAQFAGGIPALDLPTDRPRPPVQTFRGETAYRRLPPELAEKLRLLAREQGTTLFNVLLAAFQVLLHRYSGQDKFVVGSVLAGRDRPELESLVGYLINPVALKADLSGAPVFLDVLERARQTVLEAFNHQLAPPALLAQELSLARDRSRPPLFETMFIYQKAHGESSDFSAFAIGLPGTRVQVGELAMEIFQLEGHPAQFDLTLMMAEADETLLASLQYNTALFDPETIDRMLARLEHLLEKITIAPDEPVAAYPLLIGEESAQLEAWNRETQRDFSQHLTIHEMFRRTANARSEAVAVRFEDRTLTYAALDERSDRLAAGLNALGVKTGDRVGVHMQRSLDIPVALLGILKAGGAYVPLDPAFPAARLEFMMEDSALQIIVADSDLAPHLPSHTRAISPSDIPEHPEPVTCNLQPSTPDQPAYVIYTSGSTGKPKGVQIPHRAVANFMHAMQESPGFTEDDILLAVTTLSFDISVLEIFLPLVSGGQLVIAGEDMVKDGAALGDALIRENATVMQATPSTWRLMLEGGWAGLPGLKILCGGEAMPGDLAAGLLPRCGELWNMYGPTETTIWSTAQRMTSAEGPIRIGRPIANTQVYILDDSLNPLPAGIFGELCIGGAGLADGYLARPELTAEKFIEYRGERVYRTGDIARLLLDGTLDLAGRRDTQVKVRGYRIEPGEIETLMSRFEGIRQAVVAVHGSGAESRLVGYAVLEDSRPLDQAALRRYLQLQLPEYMVPPVVITLESLPLTPNGKVDRKALPAPEGARPALETDYVAPRDETEARLAAIAADILELERVGVRDHFFDLGGTSLQATRLVFRVRDEFGVQVLLRRLFEDPTVEGLARALEEARNLAQRGYGILEKKPVAELAAEVQLAEDIRPGKIRRRTEGKPPRRALLTGATGYLGAFLLRELLDRTEAEVVCLVRAESDDAAGMRVRSNLETYGLWEDHLGHRITPLPGDLEQPLLGLSEEKFAVLAAEVDVIYHNGARVNFVQTYEGHRASNVQGTHEILRLAVTGVLKPVHFVSTLSVFHTGDHPENGAFKEGEDLEQTGAPLGGYAQSKWVAEKLVQEAMARGIPASIYRPGIISGHSETGAWNHFDLVWGLARACFTLGQIPRLEGTVDVVPVDYVSRAIVHLSLNGTPDGRVYHLGNPQTYPYADMVKVVQQLGLPVDEVPFEDWRTALFRHSLEGSANEWSTFLPIIEEVEVGQIFMPRFDASNTLKGLEGSGISCPPVGPELLGHYLAFFNREGFFQ